MGKLLPVVIGIVLFVYALFDLIAAPSARIRYLPKWLWFVALLVPFAGPLAWIFVGQSKPAPPPRSGGSGGWTPPRPQSPRGPDDDPDYLRNL